MKLIRKCKHRKNQTNFIVRDCYEYLKELSENIYRNEERREDSLIQQAGHMQAVFSFVMAALFMITPLIIQNRGNLSMTFIFISLSTISSSLLFSLLFATIAQRRCKRQDFPKIAKIREYIENNYQDFATPESRNKYIVQMYEKIYDSFSKANDKRMFWIRGSMVSFYVALMFCIFWFIVAICKIV